MNDLDIGVVWTKLKSAVAISDEELSFAIKKLTKLEESLKKLGPYFHFAWREVYFELEKCQGYAKARKKGY